MYLTCFTNTSGLETSHTLSITPNRAFIDKWKFLFSQIMVASKERFRQIINFNPHSIWEFLHGFAVNINLLQILFFSNFGKKNEIVDTKSEILFQRTRTDNDLSVPPLLYV